MFILFKFFQDVWIGLRGINNRTWRWDLDGSFLSDFTVWNDGEPNDWNGPENCVEMLKTSGHWNDKRCTKVNGFMCEKKGIKLVKEEKDIDFVYYVSGTILSNNFFNKSISLLTNQIRDNM